MNEPAQKCDACKEWIDFPFGVGDVQSGLCACPRVIYKFNDADGKLMKCVVNDAWGSYRYTWSEVPIEKIHR